MKTKTFSDIFKIGSKEELISLIEEESFARVAGQLGKILPKATKEQIEWILS